MPLSNLARKLSHIPRYLREGNLKEAIGYQVRSYLHDDDASSTHWARVVMNQALLDEANKRNPSGKDAMEVSGDYWKEFPFKSYRSLNYPQFDICAATDFSVTYDMIIAEQVFEHVRYPFRAGKNLFQLLRPGGIFLISVPFLIKAHLEPEDNCRWTATGLKYFLEEIGFDAAKITSYQWGNKECAVANFGKEWTIFRPKHHSLENDPTFPVVSWAIAQK